MKYPALQEQEEDPSIDTVLIGHWVHCDPLSEYWLAGHLEQDRDDPELELL